MSLVKVGQAAVIRKTARFVGKRNHDEVKFLGRQLW